MKIAVLGPGSMGSIFAAYFAKAGHGVTLIARGKRLLALKERGLMIKSRAEKRVSVITGVQTEERLKPEIEYDLVVVTVQRHQADKLIPDLACSSCRRILMMFNCASGADQWNDALGAERVLWGFPAVLGEIIDDVVHYRLLPACLRFLQINTLGRPHGPADKPLLEIMDLFHKSGLPAACTDNMDSWLKTHAAFMAPVMASGYLHPLKQTGFQFTLEETRLIAGAIRENFTALKRAGTKLTPMNMGLHG
jgi:2-dehydropantoate 2-reductase